jgi:CubicO group peptidase (beta-lactamase class C family)
VDSTALERFLDDRLGPKLREGLAPGAVFMLVQDGRVILSKGFGVANIATREPVIPERTMFFAGSISKLITATAVTQLADRGLVDLDADVNGYLTSFAIDARYEEPVTLRHLLTHTSILMFQDRHQLRV